MEEVQNMQNDAQAVLGGSDAEKCSYEKGVRNFLAFLIKLENITIEFIWKGLEERSYINQFFQQSFRVC